MDGLSLNITENHIQQLREIFPDIFSEGKIDFQRLKAALGENVLFPGERYELSWPGKAEARREVQRQTTATLVPDLENSVDFASAQNIFIEGENLEVLRLLQKSYFGKVKMIYIDPPYNTGNDSFVYPDDFAERQEDYLKRTGAKDEAGYLNKQDLWRKNTKENGQFHSAWLSMMYPRLYLARNLMREDGVIFVSIDDNEVTNLRLLMDEVFGEENFIACIVWQKKYAVSNDDEGIGAMHDYIICYQKSSSFRRNLLPRKEKQLERYKNPDNDPRGVWTSAEYVSSKTKEERPSLWYPIIHPITNEEVWPAETAVWRYSKEKHEQNVKEDRLHWGKDFSYKIPRLKRFLNEIQEGVVPNTWWSFEETGHNDEAQKETADLIGKKIFTTPKPVRLIKRMLEIGSGKDDIILDFFAGSAATAQAVLELNAEDDGKRCFILVQMPEPLEENSEAWKAGYNNIADIGRTRIRKVIERMQERVAQKAQTPEIFETLENETQQVLGFQSYRLQYSNFKVWRNDLEGKDAILNQLQMFQEPLSEHKGKNSALLTELVLKAGFPLTVGVTEKEVDGCIVFDVDDGRMWVALDKVTPTLFQAAAEARPSVFVTLSGLFDGQKADETMANANLQLKDAGVDFKVI